MTPIHIRSGCRLCTPVAGYCAAYNPDILRAAAIYIEQHNKLHVVTL
jgi:hypothetical protein